ncbi:MAG: hypothetical protein CMH64_04190 [Nanoarchaeota archaeon]|nr:hypothetical protein [Nanoarchaeota archaeon]|tara:strand:+ start:1476 stop:1865 length:390 start_codon:yes stop_codon:yes gene_type:complete
MESDERGSEILGRMIGMCVKIPLLTMGGAMVGLGMGTGLDNLATEIGHNLSESLGDYLLPLVISVNDHSASIEISRENYSYIGPNGMCFGALAGLCSSFYPLRKLMDRKSKFKYGKKAIKSLNQQLLHP